MLTFLQPILQLHNNAIVIFTGFVDGVDAPTYRHRSVPL